jgi:DNA-binding Lrp family transcriptional regulator
MRITEHQPVTLDKKNMQLIEELYKDSSLPFSTLSKKIALNKDTVQYRFSKLVEDNVLLRCYNQINFDALGYLRFIVFFSISTTDSAKQDQFISEIKTMPQTISLFEHSDRWDFEWNLLVPSLMYFESFFHEFADRHKDIIYEYSLLLHVETYYSELFPSKSPVKELTKSKLPQVPITPENRKILFAYASDTRAPIYGTADKLNISPVTYRKRIKEFEESNLLLKNTIALDLSKLGYRWYTFACKIRSRTESTKKLIRAYAQKHENILKVFQTIGEWDVVIQIVARKPHEFHDTVREIKQILKGELIRSETLVAYKEHVYEPVPRVIVESELTPTNKKK